MTAVLVLIPSHVQAAKAKAFMLIHVMYSHTTMCIVRWRWVGAYSPYPTYNKAHTSLPVKSWLVHISCTRVGQMLRLT